MKWFAPHVYCAASIRTCFLILWTEVGNMLTQIRISAEQLSSTPPPPPPCNTFLWTIYLPWSSTCLSGLGYSCTCFNKPLNIVTIVSCHTVHRTPSSFWVTLAECSDVELKDMKLDHSSTLKYFHEEHAKKRFFIQKDTHGKECF